MRIPSRMIGILAVAILAAGCATGRGATWTYSPLGTPGQQPASGQPASATGSPGAVAGGIVGRLEFRSFEMGFEPAQTTVEAAGRYEVALNNSGTIPHDITFADGTHIMAAAGETATGEVTISGTGLDFICSIAGHADSGMKGHVGVSGSTAVTSPQPTTDGHGGPTPDTDVQPDPDAPPPVTYDASAPALLAGETHDIELVMTEREMTIAPGFVQLVWTFADTVPGPVIRVKVGDLVRIHLINPATNTMAHSIDFHASMVAWNDEMRSIAPGEELIYEWTANFAGVWMYHCGTSPALHHIANGMYGMVIVEPREGLPPVDQEFVLVQSEWYLGPQGQPVSLSKAMAAAPAPDYVVFNGVANQYVDAPLAVETGERVRVFVLNAGPSVDSSFHIVGTIFDTVIKEGVHLTPGNEGGWGSQAVDLSPAQGAIVEFELAEDGLYPVVTHAFNLVGRGALGLFQAGDGEPAN